MSEDAHWSGVDAMARRDLKVCQVCGEIYEGAKCGACPRLRANALARAQDLVNSGACENVKYVDPEDPGPATLAYRAFVAEEFVKLTRLRRQAEAIGELRHAQRSAEFYGKLPRVNSVEPPLSWSPSRTVWALVGAVVLALAIAALWVVR